MDKNELEIYKQVIKEKYRYYRLWKVLAIVFMCISVILAGLCFATGNLFTETINNTDVVVENEGESNNTNVTVNN